MKLSKEMERALLCILRSPGKQVHDLARRDLVTLQTRLALRRRGLAKVDLLSATMHLTDAGNAEAERIAAAANQKHRTTKDSK